MKRRAVLKALSMSAAIAAIGLGSSSLYAQAKTIKVGVLHSLSGTMAISETVLKDTVLMAVEEINAKGGVMGYKIEPVVVDPASNWPLFAEKARQLITQDKVAVVFGCWTSVSRKSVLPVFVQRAGIAAVTQGESVIAHTLERFRKARDFLVGELKTIPGIEVALPSGTMYAFLRVAGVTDSLVFCKKLVADFGLGLAPGAAFGPQGEGFVRWCFAAGEEKLAEGVARLRRALSH